ncbi:DUF6443 domain-containing protein [Chryseobacterium sp. 3008163]|uniref:DUF6443 domain-containing protein n=1 Tax=Chryseobacterium sp. 3008163 TaxID=2478663 RepID=UPI000F0C66CE|nr:DUF6443 domain-containing protein [Chryseobacterium sp. 3008163]AYN00136.1 RHS repeat-associated core domain-containing protein [Chryseobacterium sp. 3008163]
MMKKYKNIIRPGKLKVSRFLLMFALGFPFFGTAQTTPTPSENYTYTKIYLSEDGSKKSESVQYFDELGRPKQSVQVKATPLGQDLVVPVVYDQLGRQTQSILPVPMPTANLGIQAVSENTANTYYGVANAYSLQKLEASPLARPLEVAHPGAEWAMGSGHTQKIDYALNKNADQVKKYAVTHSWQSATAVSSLSAVSLYSEKVLTKNTATDEDGNKTIEFKNSLGQTVLVRKVMTASQNADTYYIYNDYGNLVYVISPKAEMLISNGGNTVTQQILDDLCYQYKYDNRARLVEKKLPGKGWEYMVYDKQNRLVLSQDAILRTTNNSFNAKGWMFTKYDRFGRVVYTGFFSNTGSRAAMQNAINSMTANFGNNEEKSTTAITQNGMDVYYTKNAFPTGSMTIMSVNYYDTYPAYSFNPAFPSAIYGKSVLTDQSSANVSTRTLPVMKLVKNIEDNGWTKGYVYYDNQARAIGSHSINHLGGYTRTESDLDFAGMLLQSKTFHKRLGSDAEKIITQTFTYDHQNRLLVHKHKVDNNAEEILTQNDYNELSQLRSKKVGGKIVGNGLQNVDYTYNIRGWMTQINDPANLGGDLFGYKIKYNQVEGLETPDTSDPTLKVLPKYNGNIAEVDWKTGVTANESLKRYGYVYDNMNRLSAGFYQNSTNPSLREYFEKATYDINGNINTMKRTAQKMGGTALLIDNLSYQYENSGASNRLQKISENVTLNYGYPYQAAPTDIGYDANGNTTTFPDKGISSIQYNYLDLPKNIIQNSEVTNYTYRADGVKVKKLFNGLETDYLDGFQYKFTHTWEVPSGTMTNDEIKLRIIPTSEGYFDALRNAYFYNYTDHLGNVRLSYSDRDENGEVTGDIVVNNCVDTPDGQFCNNYIISGEAEGVTNYYPFGMMHNSEYNTSDNAYQNKYNGKELQETGMYDYGARMYMSDIGRWGVVDPLAEAATHLSPYHYGNNNPLMFNDPTGMLSMSVLNNLMGSASGTTWYNTGIGFTSDAGGSMDYDGNKISWGSDYTDMLMMSVGLGPMGSGGGDVAGERLLAPLVINLPESYKGNKALTMISFSMGFQQHLSTHLGIWQQGFDSMAWVRNDGPVKMIGGMGDPSGIFDVGGQIISNWEPENQHLAMAAGIIAAITLKKPGLALKEESSLWKVGAYKEIQGLERGLDAHHVGQTAIMSKLVEGYKRSTAPSILVPKLGHTGGTGIVSRSTKGFTSARQVLARDIFELRRVYGIDGIPNSALQELIQMNKTMYPGAFIK